MNIPLQDDIYDVLQLVSNVLPAQDWQSRASLFLQQHNDHRTGASRLIYYTVYLLEGEVNFRTLTLVANLALPLTLGVLYLSVKSQTHRYLLLLPSALILFQLRSYGITLWSMAAFAYFYVFLYGFACIYALHKVTWQKFLLAIMLASFANFTLASGQVIWLLGLASLLHQTLIAKSASIRYALCWLVIAVPVLMLWNTGLETPLSPVQIFQNIVAAPVHHLHYFLALLGSAASETSTLAATIVGSMFFASLLLSSVIFFRTNDVRLELCAWYVVASVVAMVFGRAYFTEVQYALTSRYSYPSVLLLCTLWLLLALRLQIQNTLLLCLIGLLALIYSYTSYQIYSELLQPHVDVRVSRFNKGSYPLWGSPKGETKSIVAEAVSLGIYRPPDRPVPEQQIYSRD